MTRMLWVILSLMFIFFSMASWADVKKDLMLKGTSIEQRKKLDVTVGNDESDVAYRVLTQVKKANLVKKKIR